MKNRLRIAFVLLAAVVLAATLYTNQEPSYEGKTLSDWVVALHGRTAMEPEKVSEAVHHLGTNSIPLLLEWLHKEDRPTWTYRLHHFKNSTIQFLVARGIIEPRGVTYHLDYRSSYRSLAILAFSELGPDGQAAIPSLIQMLGDKAQNTNELSAIASAAFVILSKMAPASIPALAKALSADDLQVRIMAASTLGNIGPSASEVIPILKKMMTETNIIIRMAAADILAKIGGQPADFMPVLIQCYQEANYDARNYIADIFRRNKE